MLLYECESRKKFENVIREAFEKVPNVSIDRLHDQTTGFKGRKRSDEFKKKVSESQRKRLQNIDLSGENNGFYGKHHSPETIEKIRQASIRNAQLRREKKLKDGC